MEGHQVVNHGYIHNFSHDFNINLDYQVDAEYSTTIRLNLPNEERIYLIISPEYSNRPKVSVVKTNAPEETSCIHCRMVISMKMRFCPYCGNHNADY